MAAKPGFGTPLQLPDYYEAISLIVSTLRSQSSLRKIALHLNASGFRTPTGMEFTKTHVANFIRGRQYKPTH